MYSASELLYALFARTVFRLPNASNASKDAILSLSVAVARVFVAKDEIFAGLTS